MAWRIEFSSDRFLPTLPEDCQVNPGCYGFELALWLAQGLHRAGIVTGYPCEEDWGWCLAWRPSEEASVLIGCGSVCSAGDGYHGGCITWSVFLQERRSLEQRLLRRSNGAALEQLADGIETLMAESGIVFDKVS